MIPPLPNSLSLADRTLKVSSTAASTVSRFACIVRPPVDCGLTRGYRTGAMRLGDRLDRPVLLSLFGGGYTPEGNPVPPSSAKDGVRMRLQVISSQQLVHASGELCRLPDVHTEAVSRNHRGHVTAGRTFPDLLAHRLQQPQGLLFHVRPHIRVTTSHVNSIGVSPRGSGPEPSRRNQGDSIGVSLRSVCVLANIYAALLDVVLTLMHRAGGRASSAVRRARTIQDRESELPRIPVPCTPVNRPCALLRTCPLHTVHHLLSLGRELIELGDLAMKGHGHRLALHVLQYNQACPFSLELGQYSPVGHLGDVHAVLTAHAVVIFWQVLDNHVELCALDSSYRDRLRFGG